MKENIYQIGEIKISFLGNPSWVYDDLQFFTNFLSVGSPQASYTVFINDIPDKPAGQLVFNNGNIWRLYQDIDQWTIWITRSGDIPHLVGNFSFDFLSGEIFTTKSQHQPGKYVFPLGYPMGELLMTNLLGTGLGLMLHSCGVIDNGNGIVFAGVGSAGKSTTARLWNGLENVLVLNDDHTILRKIDGQFRVYGTPWHGQGGFARPDKAPLRAIFIIKHAPKNEVLRLSPSRAVADLLVRTFAPLWSASAMAFTLQFMDELCMSIPCYEFGFVPDQSAVEFVRCLSLN